MDIKQAIGLRKEEIESYLGDAFAGVKNERLRTAMIHYPQAGGKRLRPALAMISADAVEKGEGRRALPFGIALEITHNFTLVHDDIMDEDELRRGVPTVHKAFDEPTAINAGDAMFALAFNVLSKLDIEHSILRDILEDVSAMVIGIAEGQQMDMDFEERIDIKPEEYLEMIEKKTALMFINAAKNGARIAGAPPEVYEKMAEYGKYMGLAFQIWDDFLDLNAKEEELGKPVGSDIRNGKKTLMVVYALQRIEGDERDRFLRILGNQGASDAEVREAIALMEKANALRDAEALALDYAERAKRALDILDDSEEKEALLDLVDYVIRRKY